MRNLNKYKRRFGMKRYKYENLAKSLNELELEDSCKIHIIESLNRIGIDLDLCSCCMDITTSDINDGFETYCSFECLEYSSIA